MNEIRAYTNIGNRIMLNEWYIHYLLFMARENYGAHKNK